MHIHKKDSWISRASVTKIEVNSVLHCSDCSVFHRDLTSPPSIDRNFYQFCPSLLRGGVRSQPNSTPPRRISYLRRIPPPRPPPYATVLRPVLRSLLHQILFLFLWPLLLQIPTPILLVFTTSSFESDFNDAFLHPVILPKRLAVFVTGPLCCTYIRKTRGVFAPISTGNRSSGGDNGSNLRWNKLQDVIPPEIGELKSLTHLYLSFNNFKGEIPKDLANLPELRYLYLHENRFIGRIPPELGTLQHLRHLDVGNNHLVGTIRELIHIEGCFPSLRNLYLNNNYLTGGIPGQLANLTNLEILHLSYNKMSGIIPYGLAHIPRLTYLYLDHNQFSGRISDAFYKHPFLKEMYIEGNAFRPGVNPIGLHNVLEVSDTEFLF